MNGELRRILTGENQLRMNGKTMTVTFSELYTVYNKIR